MAIAKIEPLPKFDLGSKMVSWEQRRAEGKALRHRTPIESHAAWTPGKNRPDPLKLLAISNKGRQADLVPLRCGNSTALDDALAVWAESYGDQTEQDHATLVASIQSGKTKAHIEGTDES